MNGIVVLCESCGQNNRIPLSKLHQWLVVKANTEVDGQIGADHRVQSIPLMAVFDGGREVARSAGARPARAIQEFVSASLRAA